MVKVKCLIVLVLVMSGALNVHAQEKGDSLAKQLQGSWILVSIINEQDGKKSEVFGPNPRGLLILAPGGHFSMILMRATLPKFASNNRVKGTAEENQAVVQGSQAVFGTYKVTSEKDHIVMMHYEASTFPNWDGQDLPRVMTVSGDEMQQTTPGASFGGKNYLIWKRAK
jgi:hypothetical protein